MPEDPPRSAALRASDADRDRVIELLRAAVADGRLNLAEFDERLDAALAARTIDALFPLAADLIAAPGGASPLTPLLAGTPTEEGKSRGVPLHPLAGEVMTAMFRRVVRGPRSAAQQVSALALRAEADAVPLAGTRLGTAFEALVRYGKERGELGPEVDEEETVTLLALVTADAIVRWGSGKHPAPWLQHALPHRVEVILSGMTRTGER